MAWWKASRKSREDSEGRTLPGHAPGTLLLPAAVSDEPRGPSPS